MTSFVFDVNILSTVCARPLWTAFLIFLVPLMLFEMYQIILLSVRFDFQCHRSVLVMKYLDIPLLLSFCMLEFLIIIWFLWYVTYRWVKYAECDIEPNIYSCGFLISLISINRTLYWGSFICKVISSVKIANLVISILIRSFNNFEFVILFWIYWFMEFVFL